jgi:Ni,Fe-hydrogenase III small subunit/formate hydrogenlyase subunit 6/NADH:ubiquinone oxidoreductase subunit I
MWKILTKSIRTGVVTIPYPAERSDPPERFRGRPEVFPGSSLASCGAERRFVALPDPSCCPSRAIEVLPAGAGRPRTFRLDLGRCIFCGRCAEAAAEGAVRMTRDFELAARRREDLVIEVVESPAGPAEPGPAATAAGAPSAAEARGALGERLRGTIERVLGRSLHLRHLDAGSCNACDWELAALLNPTYDVQRLGIDFVASPRHADGVVVTGPVTRNLEVAVRRTFDAVPEPRLVIAVGACASSGGIVGEGYASAGGVGAVLPVDVHIPGCPPRPEAIIFGLLLAMGRLAQKIGAVRMLAQGEPPASGA